MTAAGATGELEPYLSPIACVSFDLVGPFSLGRDSGYVLGRGLVGSGCMKI